MFFDFSTLSSHDGHKLLTSTVVPRPIAWVTSLNDDGSVNVGPFSFFNVICERPPLIGIGIGWGERGDGDLKDTGENIRRSCEFVVNLVGQANARQMTITGGNFPPGVSELERAGLSAVASCRIATPRIAGSPVSLECKLYRTVDLPEGQVLVLGQVLAAHIRDDAVLDRERCHIDTPRLDLVARMHGNGWYTRMTDWFQMPTPQP